MPCRTVFAQGSIGRLGVAIVVLITQPTVFVCKFYFDDEEVILKKFKIVFREKACLSGSFISDDKACKIEPIYFED